MGEERAQTGLAYEKDNFGSSEKGGFETEKLDLGFGTESDLW